MDARIANFTLIDRSISILKENTHPVQVKENIRIVTYRIKSKD